MASSPLRLGLKVVGFRSGNGLLSPKPKVFEMRTAFISGKAMRTEEYTKPKPWPYKERGYKNRHAFFDGTQKRFDENSKVIVIEGLPGIGKTELAKSLAEDLEMLHFPMITMDDYYINEYGYNMRQLDPQLPPHLRSFDESNFIKNPKSGRSVFLQFCMFYHKYMQYVDALAHVLNTGQGVVLERSAYSDTVFADAMHTLGYLTKNDKAGYYDWRAKGMDELMKPHLIIYLDVSPSMVEENLKKRGNGEEKVYNKEFLELMEHNYKQGHLKSISEHAELLVYDWSTPGESEIVVEDIERIDFDRFDKHDPKMSDWRLKEDWDWSEKRWNFTNNRGILSCGLLNHFIVDVPGVMASGEDTIILEKVWDTAPGRNYAPGFNADMGDTGLVFKTKPLEYANRNNPIVNKA